MKYIVKYLKNPLKTGVYYSQFSLDFSELGKLFRHLAEFAKKNRIKSKELIETANALKEGEYAGEQIPDLLDTAVMWFVRFKECPKEILEYLVGHKLPETFTDFDRHIIFRELEVRRSYGKRRRSRRISGPLEPHIFYDGNDVAAIEVEAAPKENVLLLGVTSIKKEGISRFRNFAKRIPHIGKTIKEIKGRRTFSSRYTFRPYPFTVHLWLRHEDSKSVPEDLRDFLNASLRYHSEEEWRTSIVLSAIAVEVILADLYEEQFKDYAPSVPLGDLYRRLKERMEFPQEIMKAIETVNEARVSAVHRSRFPVSDREATSALCGATTFTMWYSSNF